MSSNYQNFSKGIALIPNASDLNTLLGDLNVFGVKLFFQNGSVSDALVGETVAATLTNKTLTSPIIATIVSGSGSLVVNTTGTITVPNATDTLIGKATTDTLTNKTIAAGSNTISGLVNANLSGSAGITGANIASATVAGSNIATNTVANSNLTQMVTLTLKGNNTGGTANASDLTVSQVNTMLGTLTNPMTTLGDIIYEDATPTPARLAGNTTTTKKFLTETGNGTISAPPGWNTIVNSDLNSISSLDSSSGVTIHGTNTNDSASSGYIGEYIEGLQTSATNTGASATWFDAASITLTAGDWDVTELFSIQSKAALGISVINTGISSTSGNSSSGLTLGVNEVSQDQPTALPNTDFTFSMVPSYRVSIASTTTYYLKAFVIWSTTAPQYTCRISARRMR